MVDEIVTRQELIDAKRDAQDLGKAVNEKVIVSPRYGDDFKSLPMIADEAQATIGEWESAIALITQDGGVPALAVSDASGKTQQEINDNQAVLNTGLESIADMLAIANPQDGSRVYVMSYHAGFNKGGGYFVYDSLKSSTNDYGHIIAGWVRQDITNYRVVNFGALGDWNGTTQTGADDTVAIQRCFNACLNSERNYRQGGKRTIIFNAGNYYLTKLNINRVDWFDLTVEGVGMVQLWFKGVGNSGGGIICNLEATKWKNITFNGFEGSPDVYPPTFTENDLQYIFQCFLPAPYTLPDIDIIFEGCSVHWCKEFALIRGRGFTFRNGGWGGIQGALCVIDCDPSLVFETSNPNKVNQWFDTAMRHYRVLNSRGDGSKFVVRVQGTAPCKEFIHDITISNNAIVNNEYGVINALDARLIAPKITDNFFTMCRRGYHARAVVNAVDSGNTWTYNSGTDASHYNPAVVSNGIEYVHIISDVDGIFIGGRGSTYKQVGSSVLYVPGAGGKAKNVQIKDGIYEDFGGITATTGHFIKFENAPAEFKDIHISGNTVKSPTNQIKKWTSHTPQLSYINKDNITDGHFEDFEYALKQTQGVLTYDHKYIQDGNYITGFVVVSIPESYTSGVIGNIPLPVPAIPFNASLTTQTSNVAQIGALNNLKTTKFLTAYITVSGGITLRNNTDGANLAIEHLTRISAGLSSVTLSYRYRFKL